MMMIKDHDKEFLFELEEVFLKRHNEFKNSGLKLDLTRGKPSPTQLNLSNHIDGILEGNYISETGIDTRNYGNQEGILEARRLGADWLDLEIDEVIASDNSSLTLMYQVMHVGAHYGYGENKPWLQQEDPVFIAVVPGYDRHFGIAEKLGIPMINVPLLETGPDMDLVEKLVKEKNVKGIFTVPKYSNPTGTVYNEKTVNRIAKLGLLAGDDFFIIWDNAYAVHDHYDKEELASIMNFCKLYNTEDSVFLFGSTSKVTHAGSGISFLGASKNNIQTMLDHLTVFRICPNKVNQLRHAKMFPNMKSVRKHMREHALIVRDKFDAVLEKLYYGLNNYGIGTWTKPVGGYFISFDTIPGLAKKVVELSAEAGVKLTPAGSTFPYGIDPENKNIRISPTFPQIKELEKAMDVFINCVYLSSVQYYIDKK